jgi:hypothetical protein
MSLTVIGSGFGRTGTMSLKRALEKLGLGPCNHMEEVADNPEQLVHWSALARGEQVDWDQVYAGYRSTVDWPGAQFWRELAAAYPEAKVIHSTRSAESWWASFSKTIAVVLATARRNGVDSSYELLPEMGYRIVAQMAFDGNFEDKDAAVAAFEARQKEVIESIAPERLLVYELGSGWDPLCEFLELPVPDEPFPRSNDATEFVEKFGDFVEGAFDT